MKNKNPLRRRLLRELRDEIGKYLVIFILMVATIGLCSGFIVADSSQVTAYEEGFEKYNIEDGHFEVEDELNGSQIKNIEDYGVTLYRNYYYQSELTNESRMRIYQMRTEVDKACLMSGEFPESADEIAIDRMYALNNNLAVGDSISNGKYTWKITGYVALSDYSCLFENNSDSMFDSIKFGVGVLSEEGFRAVSGEELTYVYAWKYNDEPVGDNAKRDASDDFLEFLNGEVHLADYVPEIDNQAIIFTGNDMSSDKAMILIILYIVIAIMAFVFGVTSSNTITKEANVIGTLRASGYTRGELLGHYMTLPILVTLAGALVGNILGYTFMKDFCASMYYNSYSLAKFVTIWSMEAFWMTTVIPIIMMVIINWVILTMKLRLSPLQFLRRDLTRKKNKKAIPLSEKIPFLGRFGLRVIFQNLPNYIILFIGIIFAQLMSYFGFGLPEMIATLETNITEERICEYQYMLTMPVSMQQDDRKVESLIAGLEYMNAVKTDTEGAEKFSAYSLKTVPGAGVMVDDVTLYGIEPDSSYIDLDVSDHKIYVSSCYAEKFDLKEGSSITLKEAYEDTTYTFTVSGIYKYDAALTIYMDRTYLNQLFDMDDDMFVGYFSNQEITDIDPDYIGSVIDLEALTKTSRQLNKSMGGMMPLFVVFAALILVVIIYMLSKIIIEKNAQSISMAKILGYRTPEIMKLYILPTSVFFLISLLLSLPIVTIMMDIIVPPVFKAEMTGWISLKVSNMIYLKMFLVGLATYLVVAVLEIRRIMRVPMDEALKNVE